MPAADPLIGQVVGDRYQVVRLIGSGAMGAVYEVNQKRIGRSFALKRLASGLNANPEALARFRREAEVVARLRHPNIVEIIDWETLSDGSPCIIMEYLRGEDLAGRILRGALEWSEIAELGGQILSALSVAHRAGIVHRDLKPQNIFLARDDAGERHVKLLDFGVSKIKDAETRLTSQDRLIGTPLYMSPEQAAGKPELSAPAIDVWAMGAILFEMATGDVAFGASSLPAVLYRICHGQPESLTKLRPDAPAAFVALVNDALSQDPARRVIDLDVMRRRFAEAMGRPASIATPVITPRAPAAPVSAVDATYDAEVAAAGASSTGDAEAAGGEDAADEARTNARPRTSTAAQQPVASTHSTLGGAVGEQTAALLRDVRGQRPGWTLVAGAIGAVAVAAGVWIGLVRHSVHDKPEAAIGANSQSDPNGKPLGQTAANGQNGADPALNQNSGKPSKPADTPIEKTGTAKVEAKAEKPRIRVKLFRTPASAHVTLDGAPAGEELSFADDGELHELVVSARGYAPFRRMLDRTSARSLDVTLTPVGHQPHTSPNTNPNSNHVEPPFINP